MKNIQVMKISVKSINSELFYVRIAKAASSIKTTQLNEHLSVLVDDRFDKINSFYNKAFISAKIKKEFRKYNIEINDVFFEYDFTKISINAYEFFMNKEYGTNECLNECLKMA